MKELNWKMKCMDEFLNINLLNQFRKKINDTALFYKSDEKRNWNLICASMDRLQSSVTFLNSLKNDSEENFIIFLVFSDIIFNCIKCLMKSIDIRYPYSNDYSCFHEKDINGQTVSDDKFFAYIRALAFAHTVNCNQHRSFIKEDEEQYSPFVIASYFFEKGKCGLRFYSSKDVDSLTDKLFNFSDLKKYIKHRYELIIKCTNRINDIIENYKAKWKEKRINPSDDPLTIANEIEQIGKERFQEGLEHLGIQIREYLNMKSSCIGNEQYIRIYKEKIIQSLPEVVNAINEVDEQKINDSEINDILSPSSCVKNSYNMMGYDIEKIHMYLSREYEESFDEKMLGCGPNCDSNLAWGYKRLESFKLNFSDKYIIIKFDMPREEIIFLINMLFYLIKIKTIIVKKEN